MLRCVQLQFSSNIIALDLRSTLNVHGSNLFVHPAHGLQGGEVIGQLELTTRQVLLLEDGHAGVLMVLCKGGERRFNTA